MDHELEALLILIGCQVVLPILVCLIICWTTKEESEAEYMRWIE